VQRSLGSAEENDGKAIELRLSRMSVGSVGSYEHNGLQSELKSHIKYGSLNKVRVVLRHILVECGLLSV
jgi:hypothetical protein